MSKESKVVYNLLVEFTLIPEKPVSDETLQIKLNLKNIGSFAFPGGEMTEISVRTGDISQNTQSVSPNALPKIPAIEVNQSIMLEPITFLAMYDGMAWISVKLKAVDGGNVHLFQHLNYDMGNNWGNAFKIKKQEFETMISLLKKIVELLERRKTSK